jgi:hypothetical protein
MSGPDRLAAVEAEFRRAVAGGRFEAARGLLAEHGARLQELVASGAAEGVPALENALRLMEWARRGALAGRAHRARQLVGLAARPAYRVRETAGRHTWEMQG